MNRGSQWLPLSVPMKLLVIISSVVLTLSLTSCSVSKRTSSLKNLDSLWTSVTFGNHHAGLMLYDPDRKQTLYAHNAERYFVPASNTKLFTFYAGLKTLGDSVEALRYLVRNDSLIFWGTGDPTLLNVNVPSSKALEFLARRPEKLFYWPGHFPQRPFGSGWAWNDYQDYYQPEISALPVYGNVVRFLASDKLAINAIPQSFVLEKDTSHATFQVRRNWMSNQFTGTSGVVPAHFEQHVPFQTSSVLTTQLVSDTLHKRITLLPSFSTKVYQSLSSISVDTLYKHMLQPSDNFVAEQILMLVCSKIEQPFQSKTAIDYVLKNHLTDLPDRPNWADGSGLSRYNLFTPKSIIRLLEKMYTEYPAERIFPLLAIGGQAGSIKNAYKSADGKPFIFAKTGSLSGVYNLSGYLLTKSGKTLLFSFMNNNFNRPTSEIRRDMERILTQIREKY
ncbi:D-alanyl-D-alanine carboxypeptidase/D-alanyl-D-alanine-endopeptidase (penicillin-binding protein 4) [Siphonobacter sp. BAB-5404]|nr:D-alanyl-D-alanine carboxypeptidase/D-alanyl-D-alanine-endopeptidase (penicillin-binding protein 4) [Siphonobacter sp. SORGH_AS_0500]